MQLILLLICLVWITSLSDDVNEVVLASQYSAQPFLLIDNEAENIS